MIHPGPSPDHLEPLAVSRTCPNPWGTPEIGLPDWVSGLAYLCERQIRGRWTQKKGLEAP